MQAERENLYKTLNFVDVDIAGNRLRAYYDADNKLVCVLDFLESDTKPNVLLVINPVGNRKWDDILMNDYGVDLETVRPKKDNKYQKLDVEYAGLAEYDNVLQLFASGSNVTDALVALNAFRDVAAVRAATERRDDAQTTVEKAHETIEKSREKIKELQSKAKKLRSRLGELRNNVGKEPTKQSAAKILRVEAQIDSVNEKITRTKKRLDKAEKRLASAQDEIEAANYILEKLKDVDVQESVNLPVVPAETAVVMAANAKMPVKTSSNYEMEDFEPKVENMAEDEVKPLFDENPNVLNDDIAFKPVDFSRDDSVDEVPAFRPNSLPEISEVDDDDEEELLSYLNTDDAIDNVPAPQSVDYRPVLTDVEEEDDDDNLPVVAKSDFVPVPVAQESVPEQQGEKIDSELFAGFTPLEIPNVADDYPLATSNEEEPKTELSTSVAPADEYVPIMPQPIIAEDVEESDKSRNSDDNGNTDMPEIAPAPISSDFRPVSPMGANTENDVAAATAVGATKARKPNVVYYAMLFVLVVLSVFTLWFYQRTAGDSTPELGALTQPVEVMETEIAETPEPVAVDVVQVVEEKPVVDIVEPEVVFDETVEPEVVPVSEPEPIVLTPEVEPVPVDAVEELPVEEIVEEQEEQMESPFLSDQEVKLISVEPEDILEKKPEYDVAASDVEYLMPAEEPVPEPVVVQIQQPEVVSVETPKMVAEPQKPVVEYNEPVVQKITSEEYVVKEPVIVRGADVVEDTVDYGVAPVFTDDFVEEQPLQETTSEMVVETETVLTCSDGGEPDAYGCCEGEESVEIDGAPMCCAIGTDECFPPMF